MRVLATAYVRPDGLLVALASWSEQDETVRLSVDAEVVSGFGDIVATAPAVEGLQAGGDLDLTSVLVPANQGLFVLVR